MGAFVQGWVLFNTDSISTYPNQNELYQKLIFMNPLAQAIQDASLQHRLPPRVDYYYSQGF